MTDTKLLRLAIFFFIAAFIVIAIVFLFSVITGDRQKAIDKGTCIIKTKNAGRKLLEPLHKNNTPLSFETGPECKILSRLKPGSIVLYKSPRGPDPITLKVAGMPGDTVTISPANRLIVNGMTVTNSAGKSYRLGSRDQRTQMNKIKTAHNGKLPDGHYFLMGDNDRIYLDSSRFGISNGKDILGILAEE